MKRWLSLALIAACTAAPAWAAMPVQLEWDTRLRHESVDDARFAHDASANTLRLRAGLRVGRATGWSLLLEGDGVVSAGNHYNSGANGRSQYPAITDPRGAQVNQAWFGWHGSAGGFTLGRQRVQLDNQRWVGNSGWRQHEQTFDAVDLQWQPTAALQLRYDWLTRVHRVPGEDALNTLARERKLDTHLLNAAWTRGAQQWTGYAYLHHDKDVAQASTATWGLRWIGSALRNGNGPGWTAEVATQRDHANNRLHFSHNYWLLEPSWTQRGITARLGWEHLGGNGRHALQTPLASMHPFNGWADQFSTIPDDGLEDRYITAGGRLGAAGVAAKLGWAVAWHDYRADHGSTRYGSEWGASLSFALLPQLTGLVKVADFRAAQPGRDSTKLWLQLEWRGSKALAQ